MYIFNTEDKENKCLMKKINRFYFELLCVLCCINFDINIG